MGFPFFPFKPKVKKIPKITGAPFATIRKWCKEITKVITPNPLKPAKKKTTKDKKLHLPSLQKLLIQIVEKVNEVIDNMGMVPDLEEKVNELEKQVELLSITHATDVSEIRQTHATDIGALTDAHVKDVEDTEDLIQTTEQRLAGQHRRHKHQYGKTGYNVLTGPVRRYTKRPRQGFYEEGGRTDTPYPISEEPEIIQDPPINTRGECCSEATYAMTMCNGGAIGGPTPTGMPCECPANCNCYAVPMGPNMWQCFGTPTPGLYNAFTECCGQQKKVSRPSQVGTHYQTGGRTKPKPKKK